MSSERTPTALTALEPEYWILGEIGRGGTAIVYLARDRATGDEVAIKLIRPKYVEDEEAIARFAREARFVTQLNHPNVVGVHRVLDLGAAGIALVMAHIDGRTLKQVIQQDGPLAPDFVVNVLRQVAAALAAAHRMGIVHRDVKPENIFIDSEGKALLADFGVARSMSGDTQLTMHGVAIGTPSYMAPEQIDGRQPRRSSGRVQPGPRGLGDVDRAPPLGGGEPLRGAVSSEAPRAPRRTRHAAGRLRPDRRRDRRRDREGCVGALAEHGRADRRARRRRPAAGAPRPTHRSPRKRSASSVRSRPRKARRPEIVPIPPAPTLPAPIPHAPEEQVPSPPRIQSRSALDGDSSRASSAPTSRRTSWTKCSRRGDSRSRAVRWRSAPPRSSAWWRSASSRRSSKGARMGRRASCRRRRRREGPPGRRGASGREPKRDVRFARRGHGSGRAPGFALRGDGHRAAERRDVVERLARARCAGRRSSWRRSRPPPPVDESRSRAAPDARASAPAHMLPPSMSVAAAIGPPPEPLARRAWSREGFTPASSARMAEPSAGEATTRASSASREATGSPRRPPSAPNCASWPSPLDWRTAARSLAGGRSGAGVRTITASSATAPSRLAGRRCVRRQGMHFAL